MEKLITPSDQEFLNTVFALENDPKRHEYSQTEIDSIMERTLKIIEENNLSSDFGLMCQIEGSLQLYGDFKFDSGKESITDKSYRALLRLSNKYPHAVHELENLFGQNHTVQPRVLFEAVSEIYWNPEYDNHIKSSLIYSLQYILSFGGGRYVKDMVKGLDFSDKNNYFKIASFLELIKHVAILGSEQDYSNGEILSVIEQALAEKKQEQEGSYLLNIRLNQVLETIQNLEPDEIYFSNELDRLPFLVASNVFGWHSGGILKFSNRNDFIKIQGIKNKIDEVEEKIQPPQYLVDEAVKAGLKSVMFSPDPNLSEQRSLLYRELSEYFTRTVPDEFASNFNKEKKVELFDYGYLMSKPIREYIEKDFGIKLSSLTIKEQFYFLELIKSETEEEIMRVKTFVKKYQKNGFKVFLSLEQDPNLGRKIISFGENVHPEIAEKVFKKYSDIIDETSKVTDFLVSEINFEIKGHDQLDAIHEQIMLRAKDFLVEFIDASGVAKHKGIELSGEEVGQRLDQIKTDTILLASTLRTLKQSGQKINLEDIRNFSLEGHVRAIEVTEEDIAEMNRIYGENYIEFPNLQRQLVDVNEKSLKSNNSEFAILRYKGELTGFYRLDTLSEREVHFAAFNIDAEFRGAGLGEAMMLEDLDQVAKEKIISAECDETAKISSNYIERGFIAIAHEDIGEKGALKIIRNDNEFNFVSKYWSTYEIIEAALKAKLNEGSETTQIDGFEVTILSAEKQSDFDFKKMFNDGQVLTRYFKFGEKGKEKWYIVLEKMK